MKVSKVKLSKVKLFFWFILFVFMFHLAIACPPDNSDTSDCPKEYTYDQFQTDFANNPLAAAEQHPEQYMQYLVDNPSVVTEHPEAYEAVISKDVKYLNQNRGAFMSYVDTKGIHFTSIGSDLNSFDVASGKMETRGISGETKTTLTFDVIKSLQTEGRHNFAINEAGELVYELPPRYEGDLRSVIVSGDLEIKSNEVGPAVPAEKVIISNGKFSFKQGSEEIVIEINGENKGRILAPCTYGSIDNCGLMEVESVDAPIVLPQGILQTGKARLISGDEVLLHPQARFITQKGATIEGTKETMFTFLGGNYCSKSKYSCVAEVPNNDKSSSGTTMSYTGDFERDKLVVSARDGNQITVQAQDGLYKSVVVKQISSYMGKELVGEIDGVKLYITNEEYFVNEEGIYPEGGFDALKLQNHPNYAEAKRKALALNENPSLVNLILIKSDGSLSSIIFNKDEPLAQGNLLGLQTKVSYVFKPSDSFNRYYWAIGSGDDVSNAQGVISESILAVVSGLLSKEDYGPELEIIFDNADGLGSNEISSILDTDKLNAQQMVDLVDKMSFSKEETDRERATKQFTILSQSHGFKNSESAAVEAQRILLSRLSSISEFVVVDYLINSYGREEIQKEIIDKSENIRSPGEALSSVSSEELKRAIIEKSRVVGGGDSKYARSLANYLEQLGILSPELQILAVDTINFEEYSGAFKNGYRQGVAFRRMLAFAEGKPELMGRLLDRMPTREDLGFNPPVFKEIYFNPDFQKNVDIMDSDFPEKYSVALTVQHYLERKGTWTAEDISTATTLVFENRAKFVTYDILDDGTYYIPITHEEERFENSGMVQLARDSGVRDIASDNLKGAGAKEPFLDFVKSSVDKGKTTIHFSNHGGPNHQWLSAGSADAAVSDEMRRSDAISYVELGDALAERGNLGEVTIMIDSCYSKDFADNLYGYLYNTKGLSEFPVLITETNRGQVGWVNVFSEALKSTHVPGTPLEGHDILNTEPLTFLQQDLSVTMPISSEEEQPFVNPATPGVIDLGSTDDAGVSLPPEKPSGEPAETSPALNLPPTVIEVSQNEADMADVDLG